MEENSYAIQEAQRIPNKMSPNRSTLRHIILKITRVKDTENLKAAREKQRVIYKGTPIRL